MLICPAKLPGLHILHILAHPVLGELLHAHFNSSCSLSSTLFPHEHRPAHPMAEKVADRPLPSANGGDVVPGTELLLDATHESHLKQDLSSDLVYCSPHIIMPMQ